MTTDRTAAPDEELLADLCRRRRPVWKAVAALLWLALAGGYLVSGNHLLGALYTVLAVGWAVQWWFDPRPRLRAVTADALVIQQGVRTRAVPRAALRAVRALYTLGYGLELPLPDDELVRLTNTALRFSVADAQAAALRRWAGLPATG